MSFGYSKISKCSVFRLILSFSLVFAWWEPNAARGVERPNVVATTTVVADLVHQIAGNRVEIDCLMGPGIDPHSFKATPRDADRLADEVRVSAFENPNVPRRGREGRRLGQDSDPAGA